MRVRIILFRVVIIWSLTLIFSLADTIEFFSGEILHGKITAEQKQTVKILPEGKDVKPTDAKTFYTFRIKRIIKGNIYKDYLAKKEKCQTADDFYKLGEYCRNNKLPDEAKQMYEQTIKLDTDHEKARKALGHKKQDDKWVTPDEIKEAEGYVKFKDTWVKKDDLEKAEKEEVKKQSESAYPIDLKIGVVPDADDTWLEKFSEQVKQYNQYFWVISEGLLYLNNVEITDKCSSGNYVVSNLNERKVVLNGRLVYGITRGSTSEIAGLCDRYTFAHEYGHARFNFQHHDNRIMKQGGGPKRFCDDCLVKFLSLSSKVKYRPDFPKNPPEVKIKCNNN